MGLLKFALKGNYKRYYNDLKVLSIKKEMHENTVYENSTATTTILLVILRHVLKANVSTSESY